MFIRWSRPIFGQGCWPVPSTARRARLTAAASSAKSAAILAWPRTRARRPPWRAAHQVPDLAFHLGPGGAVVGDPAGCCCRARAAASCRSWIPTLTVRPARAVSCTAPAAGSRRRPRRSGGAGAVAAARIGAVCPAGQVTVSASRSMSKRSLVNLPPAATGAWVLHLDSIPARSSRSCNSPVP